MITEFVFKENKEDLDVFVVFFVPGNSKLLSLILSSLY